MADNEDAPGINIHLFKNGDDVWGGIDVLVDPVAFPTLRDLLKYISTTIPGMERMYHARTGARVIRVEDLQDGECYVMGDKGKFLKLDYPFPDDGSSIKIRVLRNDTKTIEMAKHVLLSRQQLRSMELVRSEVGRCIGMASVYEIYSYDGKIIRKPEHLIDGAVYVALRDDEQFKDRPEQVKKAASLKDGISLPPISIPVVQTSTVPQNNKGLQRHSATSAEMRGTSVKQREEIKKVELATLGAKLGRRSTQGPMVSHTIDDQDQEPAQVTVLPPVGRGNKVLKASNFSEKEEEDLAQQFNKRVSLDVPKFEKNGGLLPSIVEHKPGHLPTLDAAPRVAINSDDRARVPLEPIPASPANHNKSMHKQNASHTSIAETLQPFSEPSNSRGKCFEDMPLTDFSQTMHFANADMKSSRSPVKSQSPAPATSSISAQTIEPAFTSLQDEDKALQIIRTMMGRYVALEDLPALVRRKYMEYMKLAATGQLAHWESTPKQFLALIILVDQYPRVIYPSTADRFMNDHVARDIVLRGVESGMLNRLANDEFVFAVSVLTHQEDIECQKLCLKLWRKRVFDKKKDEHLLRFTPSLERNYNLIKKFGRFPQRNAVLGRLSTKQEAKHLKKIEQEMQAQIRS